MIVQRFARSGLPLTIFALHTAFAMPTWGQAPFDKCPPPPGTVPIEILVLPFSDHGNTCDFTNDVDKYVSPKQPPTCTTPTVNYSGPDTIYKVSLHPGNEVAFRLDIEKTADLALILIDDCGIGTSCVSNSIDFTAPGHPEEITGIVYPPGDYYLYVDSADNGKCGFYTLTVTGVNPTPDLRLSMTGLSEVTAGEAMDYQLTVSNEGQLAATNVKVILTLPCETTLNPGSTGCRPGGQYEFVWSVGDLPIRDEKELNLAVFVKPDTPLGKTLVSSGVAISNEGDSRADDNEEDVRTTVKTKTGLSIYKHSASRNSVVAGEARLLAYTFGVHNDGPSDATAVKAIDNLPEEVSFVRFVKAPRSCQHLDGIIECAISRVANDASVDVTFQVKVEPSARDTLVNSVQVEPGAISSDFMVDVDRETDLSIVKDGLGEVAAGALLTYKLIVKNHGPSDSTGARVRDTLPPGLTFESSSDGCHQEQGDEEVTVVCNVAPIAFDDEEDVAFVAKVASSLSAGTKLINQAHMTANERDHGPRPNTSNFEETLVKVETDLRLAMTDRPVSGEPPVRAGENLLYTMTVENGGPSDSQGGTLRITLPPDGLTFVASPDGCRGEGDSDVECSVPPLLAGQSSSFRFVAAVSPGYTGPTIHVKASVTGLDEDPRSRNDVIDPFTTNVTQEADLAVAVEAKAEEGSGKLVYTLTVTNLGPSDAAETKLTLTLPIGSTFDISSLPFPGCKVTAPVVVVCEVRDPLLAGGAPWRTTVSTISGNPSATGTAIAALSPAIKDPKLANNTAILANPGDADLAVIKRSEVRAVAPGDLLQYTIEVKNHGPGEASLVQVEDDLPAGVNLVEAIFVPDTDGTCDNAVEAKVLCKLSSPLKQDEKRTILLTVRVNTDSAAELLINTAGIPESVADAVRDPDPGNDKSKVTVLRTPPFVIPFFDGEADPSGSRTLFAVKNHCGEEVCIQIVDFPGIDEPKDLCLPGKGVYSESLQGPTGYLGITTVDRNVCPSDGAPAALSGDVIRAKPGAANGLPLISTDTSQVPSELCRRWSVRFLNETSLDSSTEFFFFVPGKQGTRVTGKVYNEAGAFVQEISINESQEVFRRTTRQQFDDLEILANFGSIEWELPPGVIGNVAAIHKVAGQYEVAIPGFCRDGNPGSKSTLIVPYFEVDESMGITTFLAVRNEAADPITVGFKYFSAEGSSLLDLAPLTLEAHETRTFNLQKIPELKGQNGFIQIEPSGRASGDFLWIDPRGASGGALVDSNPDRSPTQLCNQWDVRFLQGVPKDAATDFVFYIPGNTTGSSATGKVYDERGKPIVIEPELETPNPLSAFRISAEDLKLTESGSIEWTLRDCIKGYVATVFTEKGRSPVLLPGVCRSRDQAPPCATSTP